MRIDILEICVFFYPFYDTRRADSARTHTDSHAPEPPRREHTLHTDTAQAPIPSAKANITPPDPQKSPSPARARRVLTPPSPQPFQPLASAVGFLSPWPREGDDQGRSHRHRPAVGSDGGDGARPLRDDRLAHLVKVRAGLGLGLGLGLGVRVRARARARAWAWV